MMTDDSDDENYDLIYNDSDDDNDNDDDVSGEEIDEVTRMEDENTRIQEEIKTMETKYQMILEFARDQNLEIVSWLAETELASDWPRSRDLASDWLSTVITSISWTFFTRRVLSISWTKFELKLGANLFCIEVYFNNFSQD